MQDGWVERNELEWVNDVRQAFKHQVVSDGPQDGLIPATNHPLRCCHASEN